jgi:hypothetical protein
MNECRHHSNGSGIDTHSHPNSDLGDFLHHTLCN